MINAITGFIAMALAALFFGYYAVMIDRPSLWIIIVGSLALAVTDYVLSLRAKGDGAEAGEGESVP